MATGDILQASINSDGWSATIRIEGVGVGGTYDFGFGAKNDPANAKIFFTLTSQGYNTSGVLGTTQRTVYGTFDINEGARRLPYPNQTTPDETAVVSDVDIVIPLSDYVYSADTAISVDVGAGWYTQGTASNSISGLSVTNNSTAAYQKPVGNWAYPGMSLVTADFPIEFSAFHRHDVACVIFSVTDTVTTETYTVTDLTISPLPDYRSVLTYRQVVDITNMNEGAIIVDAVVYPKVGNASSMLDTGDAVNTWPTPLYTSQTYRIDRLNDHGFTVVDPTNGNDGTGVAYSTQSAAEAGLAFQTIPAALTAIQAFNLANAGHNDAGGGTVLLPEDSIELDTNNGAVTTEWTVFKPISTATPANVIITVSTTLSDVPRMTKIENCVVSGAGFIGADNVDMLWFDGVDMQMTGTLTVYRTPASFATHCTGFFEREFDQFSTNMTNWAIVRGNNFPAKHDANAAYTVLGNRNVNLKERDNDAGGLQPIKNNCIWAFNYLDHSVDVVQIQMGVSDNLDGFAMVQNAMIRYGSQTAPFVQISADGTTTTTSNVIIWHNTIAGARGNFAYNDIEIGGPYAQDYWSVINNIFSNYNNKDDTFGSNSDATGGWPVGYSVGGTGNFFRTSATDEWFGEFQGVGANKGTAATPLEPLYVDDQSADGGNTSGGDYHLQETSPARDLVLRDVLPFDLDGRARLPSGSTGAFEFLDNIDFDLTSGSITTSGNSIEITILSDIDIDLTSGSVAITGDDLSINLNRELSLSNGNIEIIGQSVDISISSPSNIDFNILSGSVSISGDNIEILVGDAVPYIQELLINSNIQLTLSLSSNIQSTIQLEGKI